MISIGASVGGPEHAFFLTPFTRMQRYLSEYRNGGTSSGTVNVIFHLPDRHEAPDGAGLRIDDSSLADGTLTVRASVDLPDRDELAVLRTLFETVDASLALAKQHFGRRSIRYDDDADRQVLLWWKRQEGFATRDEYFL